MVLKKGFDPPLGKQGESNARYYFTDFIDFTVDRSASTLALQCWMGLCTIRCFDFNRDRYCYSIAARQDITAEA
jgi:hypothetical protein